MAYQRGQRLVLFSPAWRAHRTLEVSSLEELSPEHFPSTGGVYRWASVATCRRGVSHPIELMDEAAGRPAPAPSPAREAEQRLSDLLAPMAVMATAHRGAETFPGEETGEPAVAPETVLAELQALLRQDPEALRPVADLLTALANPSTRPLLRGALRAFATAARGSPKEPAE